MSETTKTAWWELLPVPPSVSLASSIQLSMPIRVDLTGKSECCLGMTEAGEEGMKES
jgi:hypothetical protein